MGSRQGRWGGVLKRFYAAALAVWLVVPSLAFAGVPEGIAWLDSQSNPNGSVGGTPTSLAAPVQSTAEALRAFQFLGQQNQPSYGPALNYLNGDAELNTEFLARKIVVNAAAGGDVSAFVAALVAHQNADGGFGDRAGYDSSVHDTAFALEALAAAQYAAGQVVGFAAGYLLDRQQADGGWLDGVNAASVPLTAQALRALQPYRNTYAAVPAALAAGQSFLLSKRNASGLWNESFETALALIAILPNLTDLAPVEASIGALGAAQLGNGSWADDAYTTALALYALHLVENRPPPPTLTSIEGRVVDAVTGLPLAGVTVTASGPSTATTSTDSAGRFRLTDLAPGSYMLGFSLNGYVSINANASGTGGVTFDLGSVPLTQVANATTGTVLGTVLDGDTGLPLPGVDIGTSAGLGATTGQDGKYQITNVPPGTVTVVAERSGYATVQGSGEIVAGGLLIFSPKLSKVTQSVTGIQGTIREAASNQPLPGVSISVTGPSTASATTDAQGNFTIDGLNPGSYAITASLGGYQSVSGTVTLPTNTIGVFSPVMFPAAQPTTGIQGTVTDAATSLPLAGVSITVNGAATGSATTDAQGAFVISGLVTGNYTVTASLAGYQSVSGTVALASNTVAIFSPALTPAAEPTTGIRGTILDGKTGQPLDGVSINVTGAAVASATTDAQGSFAISGLPAGDFTITASLTGYQSVAGTVTLPANAVATFSPLLFPEEPPPDPNSAGVKGFVLDAGSNLPLPGVAITLVVGTDTRLLTSAADGSFAAGNLTVSTATLAFGLAGYDPYTLSVPLQANTVTDLGQVRLRKAGAATLLPDFTVLEIDTAGITNNIYTLEIGGTLGVTIANQGTAATQRAFDVVAYYDANRDGRYVSGEDLLLGALENFAGLNIGESRTIQVAVDNLLPFRDAPIAVLVDSSSSVIESDETNNLALTSESAGCGQEIRSWATRIHATDVASTNSGGEALAADLITGDLFSKSENFPNGCAVQFSRVALNGAVTVLATFNGMRNSSTSGILLDPLTGRIIVADEQNGVCGNPSSETGRIALVDPSSAQVSTLFDVPWFMNPAQNGRGQQRFAADSSDPDILYFWDNSTAKLYRLARTAGTLTELLALDSASPDGLHHATFANDLIFDSETRTLLLTDGSANRIIEVDPGTAAVTTLFAGLEGAPRAIALNPSTAELFVQIGNEIHVGPRSGGSLSLVAEGFTTLTDIVIGKATASNGLALFAVDRALDTIYEITPSLDFTPVDLTVSVLKFTTQGSQSLMSARVGNAGTIVSPATATLAFYEGDPQGSGILLGTTTVGALAPGEYRDITLTSTVTINGSTDIYAVVDPQNTVSECREDNNVIAIAGPALLPDLQVSNVDASGALSDPQTFDVDGDLVVTVHNEGVVRTPLDLEIVAFIDRNLDGRYDPAIDTHLGRSSAFPSMAGGDTVQFTLAVTGTLPFRDAPIHVWLDSAEAVVEAIESNNFGVSAGACQSSPPPVGTVQPVLKWAWRGSGVLSSYRQVMSIPIVAPIEDTNGDGRIDGSDVPAVIFHTFSGSGYSSNGVLRAVRGGDGRELWTVTNSAYRTVPAGSLAAADIDNDGIVEIIAPRSGGGVIAFEHDGTFKWQSTVPAFVNWGGASIADIDADGVPEIVIGNTVLNANGTLRWQGAGFIGSNGAGPLSVVADLDLDGYPEIVAGAAAYSRTGALVWQNTAAGDGFVAIGNFDDDAYPEIALVSGSRLFLLNHAGAILWGPVSVPGGGGGAPTIADMDGDGFPEIGVAGASSYAVFRRDGTVLWTAPTQDLSSRMTGSSVFDFNGDGHAEVVYADERFLRVYSGNNGTVVYQTPNTSGTTYELPVIVDVDRDGHADIVVCTNDYAFGGYGSGIRVYRDANNSWVPTRSIWNQHTYHINNVNDDGTIPATESLSWLTHNTYRLNTFADRNALALADLSIGGLTVSGDPGTQTVVLGAVVGNGGAAPSGATRVSFYAGEPAAGGTLLGEVAIGAMQAGQSQTVSLLVPQALAVGSEVFAIVDFADAIAECREDNNRISALVPASRHVAMAVATDKPVYGPASPVVLQGLVSNASILTGSYTAQLQVEDLAGAIVQSFPAQSVTDLAGGASATVTNGWDTGQVVAGTYRLHGWTRSLTGEVLAEATSTFEIRNSDEPGVPVVTLRTTTDRPVYNTTDRVEIADLVQNVSANTNVDNASLTVVVKNPSGQGIFTETFPLGQLTPGALREALSRLALTAAPLGTYRVHGTVVDGANQAVLAEAEASFAVIADLARALKGLVTVEHPTVEMGQVQTCTDTAENVSSVPLPDVELHHALVNPDTGQAIAESVESVTLAIGGKHVLARPIATDALQPGNYACVLQARVGADLKTLAYATFKVVPPPIRIDAALSLGPRGRLLVLLDNGGSGPNAEPCSSVTSLSLATSFVGLSPAAALEARLYDGTGVLVDTETAALASFAGEVDTAPGGTGANLVFAELTAQSAVLRVDPLAPGTPLGAGYRLDLVVTDGSPLIVSSGLIHTDCSQTMQVGDLYGAFAVTALTAVPATDNAYRDDDPHGPQDSPGLLAQRRFLERLLTAAGWSYTITDTAEAFTRELRTGGYRTYALFDEQEKLPVDVQKELREAAFRGEGLLLAGNHDARHHKLLDAAGVKLIGNVSHAVTAEHEPSPLALAGGIGLYPLDKALRIKRLTADRFASYRTSGPSHDKNDPNDCRDQAPLYDNGIPAARPVDECEGAPDAYLDAATLNGYGRGRAAFVGVDLLALATRDGDASLAAATILKALAWVSPGEPAYTVGAVVPIRITLTNQGIATVASVTLQAANLAFVDLREGSLVDDATVVIDVALAVGETKTLDLWVRLANLPGPASLTATVTAPTVGLVASAVYPLEAVQPETLGSIKARLDALIGANHPDRHALELAAADLERALQNFDPARAIADVLKATDALLGLADPAIVDIRAALGTWVGWAGAYAY